nr:T9SS type A sorting domain-containing protein [Saprospiraceae bacterium]
LSGQVTITDISGRTIYSIQKTSDIDQIEIDLNFNSGVYILHFSTDREKYNTKFFR